jgi:hypothetical protein
MMKNTAMATTRTTIMLIKPTQKPGSVVPKISGLGIAAVPKVGNQSAGQIVSQLSHLTTGANRLGGRPIWACLG